MQPQRFHITVRRTIFASRELVWAAWTHAEAISRWMSGGDLEISRCDLELRVGGALRIDLRSSSSGRVLEHVGRYLEIVEPERLRFAWVSEGSAGRDSLVTIELRSVADGTELTLTHEGLPSDDLARTHTEAWGDFLDSLAREFGDGRRFEMREALAVLERTPRVLEALLDGLPAPWHDADEGPNTWNARDIVGHLIHGERTDWLPRVRRILAHGERLAFEPFDRTAMLRSEESSMSSRELLSRFAALRRESLAALATLDLQPEDLEKRGMHPALGSASLRELLATWVVHDLGHLAQIARVMSKRYTLDVGPWKAYLPVLTR